MRDDEGAATACFRVCGEPSGCVVSEIMVMLGGDVVTELSKEGMVVVLLVKVGEMREGMILRTQDTFGRRAVKQTL